MKIVLISLMFLCFCTDSKAQIVIDSSKLSHAYEPSVVKKIIENFKNEYLDRSDTCHFVNNNSTSKAVLNFLNHDFETSFFDNFCLLEHSNFHTYYDGAPVHLYIIYVKFKTTNSLNKAIAVIKRSHRNNFLLPVLTRFVVKKEGTNGFIMLSSETPDNSLIKKYFNHIER